MKLLAFLAAALIIGTLLAILAFQFANTFFAWEFAR